MVTIKTIKANVRKEFSNIKLYATTEEITNLLNALFYSHLILPTDSHKCIYGHITGNCFNHRANELIEKCASINKFCEESGAALSDMVYEQPIKHKQRTNKYNYFSYIEVYLANDKEDCIKIAKSVFKNDLATLKESLRLINNL